MASNGLDLHDVKVKRLAFPERTESVPEPFWQQVLKHPLKGFRRKL